MAPKLSVAIVARDEEENLRRTLPSIAGWVDEIVVVDSGSTDGTVALAESYGARVVHQAWLGFGPQKNLAISQCTGDWILSLDADEEPDSSCRDEIRAAICAAESAVVGFTLRRRNFFLGRWMRHGGMYPDPKLRVFRRGLAHFEDRPVHESMLAEGPTRALRCSLLHYAYPSLALYLDHMNRYAAASVPLLLRRKKSSASLPAFVLETVLNPLATFAYNYGLRGGFLDGREGLLLHLYHSCYVSWKYAKAWEATRVGADETASSARSSE